MYVRDSLRMCEADVRHLEKEIGGIVDGWSERCHATQAFPPREPMHGAHDTLRKMPDALGEALPQSQTNPLQPIRSLPGEADSGMVWKMRGIRPLRSCCTSSLFAIEVVGG
jgi:hypothetical protein